MLEDPGHLMGPDPVAQRPLRVGIAPGGPGQRRQVAVQHQRADRVGKQVGVGGAKEGAIGHTPIGQRRTPGGAAKLFQIAGHIGGGDMGQQIARPLGAGLTEGGIGPGPVLLLVVADRKGAEGTDQRVLLIAAVETLRPGRLADAPGIPADHVEGLPHRLRELAVPLRELPRAGAARTAGVEEQDALGVPPRRRHPPQRQPDRRAVGRAIVQRHRVDGAFQPVDRRIGTGRPQDRVVPEVIGGRLGRGGSGEGSQHDSGSGGKGRKGHRKLFPRSGSGPVPRPRTARAPRCRRHPAKPARPGQSRAGPIRTSVVLSGRRHARRRRRCATDLVDLDHLVDHQPLVGVVAHVVALAPGA